MAARTATANINGDLPALVKAQFARIQEVLSNAEPSREGSQEAEAKAKAAKAGIADCPHCPPPSTDASPPGDGSAQ